MCDIFVEDTHQDTTVDIVWYDWEDCVSDTTGNIVSYDWGNSVFELRLGT